MTPAIAVRDLSKGFKKNHVLKSVSFTVESGQVFALLGSNGAGKTTTIYILTTLMTADGGTATVNGFDVAKQPDKVRQSISLTGQFAAVDDILTARENLELIGDRAWSALAWCIGILVVFYLGSLRLYARRTIAAAR